MSAKYACTGHDGAWLYVNYAPLTGVLALARTLSLGGGFFLKSIFPFENVTAGDLSRAAKYLVGPGGTIHDSMLSRSSLFRRAGERN
ncbi:MAG: hypothetical protein JO247_15600 [Chloroflexi bacterium]|nr:hypothetical protein [Chloroflexota bacterium]